MTMTDQFDNRPAIKKNNGILNEYKFDQLIKYVRPTGEWRKAGHNTYVRWHEDRIEVRLHHKVIAHLMKDSVRIYVNEWHTPTTADRLSRVLLQYGLCARVVGSRMAVGPIGGRLYEMYDGETFAPNGYRY